MPDVAHQCAVLLVDDDPDSQEMVRLALSADGYAVAIAATGRDALVHLRSTANTCIIVLDLTLPQMDGAHFRAAQLRDRSLAWIPVVVISGTVEGAARARELGARAFIPKPVDLDRLRAALRRIGCCQARPRDRRPADTAQLAGGFRTP
jgi:CheY-like chemotaxis protein